MRIRSIKPEWLDDERLALASSDARVLSIALVLMADDYGNGRANVTLLAGRVFPGKVPETLANALVELAKIRFVVLYEADGQQYYSIRNWDKHQRVDKPGKPQVPPPSLEGVQFQAVETSEKIPVSLANVPGSLATEGKGKEGKGIGSERRPSRLTAALSDPRVVRILDAYRRLHGKDERWRSDAKEDGKPRALIVLDALEGSGRDQLTEDEVLAALRGNKADKWHADVGKHELSYVLRADKVHGFIQKGRAQQPIAAKADEPDELTRIQAEIDAANKAGQFGKAAELRERGYQLSKQLRGQA